MGRALLVSTTTTARSQSSRHVRAALAVGATLLALERRTTFIVDRQGRVRWVEAGSVCIDTSRTLEALTRIARER